MYQFTLDRQTEVFNQIVLIECLKGVWSSFHKGASDVVASIPQMEEKTAKATLYWDSKHETSCYLHGAVLPHNK